MHTDWHQLIFIFSRRLTGQSNESLDSSGDVPSSEQRATIHHYPPRSIHPYYGDESDEGLVPISELKLPFLIISFF